MVGAKIDKTLSYMNRGIKYMVLAESHTGTVFILSRGLEFISKIDVGEPIVDLHKHSITLAVGLRNKIGFLNSQKWEFGQKWCNSGTHNLTSFILDVSTGGNKIYA